MGDIPIKRQGLMKKESVGIQLPELSLRLLGIYQPASHECQGLFDNHKKTIGVPDDFILCGYGTLDPFRHGVAFCYQYAGFHPFLDKGFVEADSTPC